MTMRLFYAAAGPANLIAAHEHWQQGKHLPTEVSVTFSEQIEQYCADVGATAFMISPHPDIRGLRDGFVEIEHRPKRIRHGLAFHVEEVRYGLGLLNTARGFGADVALLDSGCTHYFMMLLFRICGMRVVPVLHNSLWPSQFRPRTAVSRMLGVLDGLFWRFGPTAVISVSPEVTRQVETIAPRHRWPIVNILAQFRRSYFAGIAPPPPHGRRPFQVMFIGRVNRIKGVLDIPEMARRIEDKSPGLVRWVICGRGPDADALAARVQELGVGHVVEPRGWTSLEDLAQVYSDSHAAIVPTRSDFCEGLAMTAAEAALAGRPLISNPVVPALEILSEASVAGRTNDPASHADAVYRLATDGDLYARLAANCARLSEQFYDRRNSLTTALHHILDDGAGAVAGGAAATDR